MIFNLNTAKALLGAVVVVAGTVTAITQPASAIGLFTTAGPNSPFGGVTTVDFSGPSVPGSYTEDGITFTGGNVVSGSVVNENAAPPGNLGQYLTLGGAGASNPVTIALNGLKGYFGLFVGSVDSYNTFEFFNGALSLGTFSGSNLLNPANGRQGPEGATYANFFADKGDLFDTVVLSSSRPALEVDNVAVREAIPTPALLPGLFGLGVAAWRKRKGQAAEQAEA